LAAADSARDGQHGKPVTRAQAAHNLTRLLETDADLECETRCAQPPLVARQDTTQATGHGVRTVGRTQTRGAETIQAALVQSLIREAPGDRFAGSQLFATHCTRLPTNPGLNVGERSSSATRRTHVRMTSNCGATEERTSGQEAGHLFCSLGGEMNHAPEPTHAPEPKQSSRSVKRDPWQRMLLGVRNKRRPLTSALEYFSRQVTAWAGSSSAFALALLVIVVWAATGPLFHFSDTWQLVINTGTTIVTFLMVFLIQRSQNKDAVALHLKLNEIVAALHGASNRLINVEDLTEGEVKLLHRHYGRLAQLSNEAGSLTESHSIEQAVTRHASKQKNPRQASVPDPMA